jgi:hypothetical protein
MALVTAAVTAEGVARRTGAVAIIAGLLLIGRAAALG